jgi:hypothetical protein
MMQDSTSFFVMIAILVVLIILAGFQVYFARNVRLAALQIDLTDVFIETGFPSNDNHRPPSPLTFAHPPLAHHVDTDRYSLHTLPRTIID